jgi:hypothetical protein
MLNHQENDILEDLIETLPVMAEWHAPGTPFYKFLNRVAIAEAKRHFSEANLGIHSLKKSLKT